MILASLLIAVLGIGPAVAVTTPKAFVEQLYAGYRDPDFNPLARPERVFSRQLISAIKEDARLARGEVGYVDADPVCQCQDASGMRATVVKVKMDGANKATANVTLGFDASRSEALKFNLVRTKAGWRISDVSSPSEPSLLMAIESANRRIRAKR